MAVAIVVFWRYVGFNLMLYLAALQTIPRDLYEAATLDGAGPGPSSGASPCPVCAP